MERGGGFHGYQRPHPHPHPTFGPGIQPPPDAANNECLVREQDRFMPIANVIRIMRKSLPNHAKISDDAKETIQECVSEFISFVTGEANDRCQCEQRKTITAEDILWAMNKLGFDDYIEPLTIYLHRYRELEYGGERGSVRGGDQSLIRRADADAGSKPFGNVDAAFGPVFRMGGQLFGPASMGGFLNDPANAGPSRRVAAVAGFEPYAPYKE